MLAVAVGLVCAGIWLPLPVAAATPSRKAVITTLAALIVAVAAWLVCVGLYVHRYLAAYHLPASKAAPPDHIAPITVVAVIVVFLVIIIVTHSSLAGWALDGFGYPFGTVPTALNIASKLLAFVAVLTLFLPRQPPVTASTPVAAESAAAS